MTNRLMTPLQVSSQHLARDLLGLKGFKISLGSKGDKVRTTSMVSLIICLEGRDSSKLRLRALT